MLSEYGLWDGDVSDVTRAQLTASYIRRKQFEARIIAAEVSRIFAGVSEEVRSAEKSRTGNKAGTIAELKAMAAAQRRAEERIQARVTMQGETSSGDNAG